MKQKVYNLLRWSEKYIKTDMVYLTKGGFWLTVGQMIASLSSFILAIAFAHYISKEVYGQYKYLLALAGILTIPTLGGINTSLARSIARGLDGSAMPAFRTRVRWSSLTLLSGLIGSIYYYLNGNTIFSVGLLIIGIGVPIMEVFGIYDAILNGKKLFAESTKFYVVSSLVATLSTLMAILLNGNLFILLITYFVAWALTRFVIFKITTKKYLREGVSDLEVAVYGKHLTAIDIINSVASQIDKILLFHYLGPVQLAIYSFAVAIPEQIKGLFKNISTLVLPKLSQKEVGPHAFGLLMRKIMLFSGLVIIVTIIYIFAAPYIYRFLFPQYITSVAYSQIFSISLIGVAAIIPLTLLQAHAKARLLYIINAYGSTLQIISLVFLIYFFGIMGAIVARVISRVAYLALSLSLTHREYRKV